MFIRNDVVSSVRCSVAAWWPGSRPMPILGLIGKPSHPVVIQASAWEYAQGSWLAPERRVRQQRPLVVRLLSRV